MASSFSEDDEMMIEEQLRERLRKVEALYLGAATAGERDAAEAAAARLIAKLEEACRIDRPDEMKFSFPDLWSVRLFIALCRRYGLRPYRYPRQRNTTVMVKAPRRFFDAVVWRQFNEHADLRRASSAIVSLIVNLGKTDLMTENRISYSDGSPRPPRYAFRGSQSLW